MNLPPTNPKEDTLLNGGAIGRRPEGAPSSALRVLVVDDEELARLRLRGLVDECPVPRANVVGEAANVSQALVWLATAPSWPPNCAARTDRRRSCSSPRMPSMR